jgi:predicted butyrate kinase (DUF1464 family)
MIDTTLRALCVPHGLPLRRVTAVHNAEVYLMCLTHAFSTETEEIMGLLLGDVMVRYQPHATTTFPCPALFDQLAHLPSV